MLPLCLELVPVCASQHPASPGPRPCARPFVSLWISGIIYFSLKHSTILLYHVNIVKPFAWPGRQHFHDLQWTQ